MMIIDEAEQPQVHGFPVGYFVIRSLACNRVFDVLEDSVEDGTEIALWAEKDSSLVENLRNPLGNNQVFFIDTSGALCSRSSGHAIDVEDDRLVLRHRRPLSYPFPNAYSHLLPKFSYDTITQEISVTFASDPSYAVGQSSGAWRNKSYILASIPTSRPRSIIDDASSFITSAISSPLAYLSGGTFGIGGSPLKATPEEVFDGEIDLNDEEVLEQERGEEGEVDDSPEALRRLRVLTIASKETNLGRNARLRRKWEVLSLRRGVARRRNSKATEGSKQG